MKARLTASARADIADAASWYESQRRGLGREFIDRVLEAVERIEQNPLGYMPKIDDVRRCGLRQFTAWGLWFRLEAEAIVIACISGKRDLRSVRERVRRVLPFRKPEP